MPSTRASRRVDPNLVEPDAGTDAQAESRPPPRPSRQRNSARSKTIGGRGVGHKNQERNNPEQVHEDVEEDAYYDDGRA